MASDNPYRYTGGKIPDDVRLTVVEVDVADGVKTIDDHAFDGCNSLSSIKISDGLKKIGNRAFYYCQKLSSIKIPDGVETIGNDAFLGCHSLSSIQIPDGVEKIGESAFSGCGQLSSVLNSRILKSSRRNFQHRIAIFQQCLI